VKEESVQTCKVWLSSALRAGCPVLWLPCHHALPFCVQALGCSRTSDTALIGCSQSGKTTSLSKLLASGLLAGQSPPEQTLDPQLDPQLECLKDVPEGYEQPNRCDEQRFVLAALNKCSLSCLHGPIQRWAGFGLHAMMETWQVKSWHSEGLSTGPVDMTTVVTLRRVTAATCLHSAAACCLACCTELVAEPLVPQTILSHVVFSCCRLSVLCLDLLHSSSQLAVVYQHANAVAQVRSEQ
jgi:hypothetical protein